MTKVVMYTFTYKDENNQERLLYARSKEYADEVEAELQARGVEYTKKKSLSWRCDVV